MRLLLVQDAPYLPSFGGGNKANRYLMAALAARGHACAVLARAVTAPTARRGDDASELAKRGIAFERAADGTVRYVHQNVQVRTMAMAEAAGAIAEARADCVIVSDDPGALLDAALRAAPERVACAVHTHLHLPFGPDARQHDAAQHARMRRARIIALSAYVRDYLAAHGGLASTVLPFPVYERGPFAPPAGDCVTLINPCAEKGLPVFLALADAFPETPFAAVPTWGATAGDLAALRARPNVALLPPSDDVGEVLRRTRILLVPSLIRETFGHVTVDAMLRGIPVLASNLGGLPEGKLGIDYVLPVPDPAPWREALGALLRDESLYARVSAASRAAAEAFVDSIDVGAFERFFAEMAR